MGLRFRLDPPPSEREKAGERLSHRHGGLWFLSPGARRSRAFLTARISAVRAHDRVPPSWRGKRIFLVVGASDWKTTAWLDGIKLGEHQGGYTPFAFELTPRVTFAGQRLTLRVDDTAYPFKLEGKQGYGKARGLWQTAYLEARGATPAATVHFTPEIDRNLVTVDVRLLERAPRAVTVRAEVSIAPTSPARQARLPAVATARVSRLVFHVRASGRWRIRFSTKRRSLFRPAAEASIVSTVISACAKSP